MPRTFVWHPGKGPAKTPKQNLPERGNVRITQVRSGIGHSARMRATLTAIGLKHHQDVVVKPITASLKGQLKQVRHLVAVVLATGEGKTPTAGSKGRRVKAPSTQERK